MDLRPVRVRRLAHLAAMLALAALASCASQQRPAAGEGGRMGVPVKIVFFDDNDTQYGPGERVGVNVELRSSVTNNEPQEIIIWYTGDTDLLDPPSPAVHTEEIASGRLYHENLRVASFVGKPGAVTVWAIASDTEKVKSATFAILP